jgi:hypothetical protein
MQPPSHVQETLIGMSGAAPVPISQQALYDQLSLFNQSNVRNLPPAKRRRVTACCALVLLGFAAFGLVYVLWSVPAIGNMVPVGIQDSLKHASPEFAAFATQACDPLLINLTTDRCDVDGSELAWRASSTLSTWVEVLTIAITGLSFLAVSAGVQCLVWLCYKPNSDSSHMGLSTPLSAFMILVLLMLAHSLLFSIGIPDAAQCPPSLRFRGHSSGREYRACPITLNTTAEIALWSNQTPSQVGIGTGGFVVGVWHLNSSGAPDALDIFVGLTFSSHPTGGKDATQTFVLRRALQTWVMFLWYFVTMTLVRKQVRDIVSQEIRRSAIDDIRNALLRASASLADIERRANSAGIPIRNAVAFVPASQSTAVATSPTTVIDSSPSIAVTAATIASSGTFAATSTSATMASPSASTALSAFAAPVVADSVSIAIGPSDRAIAVAETSSSASSVATDQAALELKQIVPI